MVVPAQDATVHLQDDERGVPENYFGDYDQD